MREYISLDIHKRYSLAGREEVESRRESYVRINHARGVIAKYLSDVEPGTTVAVEATGNWYWIVDEIERAKMKPALVHPYKAKVMLGSINKTDKLDVGGLNRLQRIWNQFIDRYHYLGFHPPLSRAISDPPLH